MNKDYARDLDLNLLRVFVVVAEEGSVTRAAAKLYLTQPAVSAALRRLTTAIGAPLFARVGRGIEPTARGSALLAAVRPHLAGLVDATLAPAGFDPRTSDRVVRLGLADATEPWLLPQLLGTFADEAPKMRVIALPVQFRTVREALSTRRVDIAVTVADDLPDSIARVPLFAGTFVCLFDPRRARVKRRVTEKAYFEHEHVIVSYNGDLRGLIEDAFQRSRSIRCSVSTFANLGAIVDGSALLATVPELVADEIRATRRHLRTAPLPFSIPEIPMEMLWLRAVEDDAALRFVRDTITHLARAQPRRNRPPGPASRRRSGPRA